MVEGGGSRSYKGRGRRLRRETLYETELLPVIPADQRRKPYSFGEEKILVSERGGETTLRTQPVADHDEKQ
jgi:hypothetical protein